MDDLYGKESKLFSIALVQTKSKNASLLGRYSLVNHVRVGSTCTLYLKTVKMSADEQSGDDHKDHQLYPVLQT